MLCRRSTRAGRWRTTTTPAATTARGRRGPRPPAATCWRTRPRAGRSGFWWKLGTYSITKVSLQVIFSNIFHKYFRRRSTRAGRQPRVQTRPRPAREDQEPGAAPWRLELHCPGEIRPPAIQRLLHRGRSSGRWVHRVCKPSLAPSLSLPPCDVLYSPQTASGLTGRWRLSAASSAGAATPPSPGGSSPATTVTTARTR